MSKSGYYSHKLTTQSEKTVIENEVINCFNKHNGNYGRVRIHKELKAKGISVSQVKIMRILKENNLVAKVGRNRKIRKAPKPTEEQYISENLIKDKFNVVSPNILWCTDLSEMKCRNGKIYVSAIIDVATRRIVAILVAKHCRQELVQDTIKMACERIQIPDGAVFHSDRGCQYTAKKTKELIESYGFKVSMSRPGTPSDNQPIESFWKTLKGEIADISKLTFEESKQAILNYVYLYYNAERINSGIGYQTPNAVWNKNSLFN